MQRQNHPLNDEFDIENPVFDVANLEIKIPEAAELKTITDLALQAYQMIMQNLMYVEPESRTRQMEVAKQYLTEAKDAIYKAEQIRIKLLAESKAKKGTGSPDPQQAEAGTTSRDELLRRVK